MALLGELVKGLRRLRPTYTNRFGSSEQPVVQSPLKQVCTLQKRDTLVSRCEMGVVQQTL